MLPEKDEVVITVSLHELDFVSVLRAARHLDTSRENVIRQAVANYLVQAQRQGMDVGIQLPDEPGFEPKSMPETNTADTKVEPESKQKGNKNTATKKE